MARVTYGSGVTELAGSIGGVTYQKNASGNIAKLRSNPTVNPTALQAGYQNNLSYCVAYWPTLSQANKDLWGAFALVHNHTTPWAETRTLSGYQWFLTVNLSRMVIGEPIIDAPAGFEIVAPPAAFVIQISATYIRLYWAGTYAKVKYLLLYVTLPLRQSSLKLRRSLFYLDFVVWGASIEYWDFTTEYEALTGVTWADFYASADCSIIARVKAFDRNMGIGSSYTSDLIKIE